MKHELSNVRLRLRRIIQQMNAQIEAIESFSPGSFYGEVFQGVKKAHYWVTAGNGRIRHVADKVSASLASTGTPSYFVDSANDLRALRALDSSSRVLLFSRRNESLDGVKELLEAVPVSVPVDLVTDSGATLRNHPGHVFPLARAESDPLDTENDLVSLALGDSFVAGLESARGFTELDFLKDHPKGSLGKNIAAAKETKPIAYLPPATQALVALKEERDGVQALLGGLDEAATAKWLELFARPWSRVITTGMGKPGYCMRYLTVLLNELGRSSFYLHPAEGVHGDLGRIGPESLVVAYSHSGETEEVLNILPRMKERGATLLALCNNPASSMGKAADGVLKAGAPEVDPIRKAPTGSTTAALSLAVSLVCSHLQPAG